jgi:hypothetical protein
MEYSEATDKLSGLVGLRDQFIVAKRHTEKVLPSAEPPA